MITLVDANQAAGSLEQELKLSLSLDLAGVLTDEFDEPVSPEQAFLYNAVSILRAEISQIGPSDHYLTQSEVILQRSVVFVTHMLQTFIIWLIKTEAYDSTSTDFRLHKSFVGVVFLLLNASCSTVLKSLYPGFVAQLHNEFGSRHFIDTLHLYGCCVSFDDLMRFMTSAAEVKIETLQKGVCVPNDIVSINDGGNLIRERDDNIDINAETVDGKNTFHSIARVVFRVYR